MNCTRCDGTGFLNIEQVDEEVLLEFDRTGDHQLILDWIDERQRLLETTDCRCHICPPCHRCVELLHDVCVCDCCGDEDVPGEHKEPGDCR